MMNKLNQYIDAIVRFLDPRNEFIQIFLVPFLIFSVDFVLRLSLGVDVRDIGADMALLAAVGFLSLALEDKHGQSANPPSLFIIFLLLFMIPWIFCLRLVSATIPSSSVNIGVLVVNIQLMNNILSWFVGLASLFFSGVIIYRVNYLEQANVQLSEEVKG